MASVPPSLRPQQAVLGEKVQESLPPGLRIEPIRSAARPASWKRGVILTSFIYSLLLVAGPYLVQVLSSSGRRTLVLRFQSARLLLDDSAAPDGNPDVAAGGNSSPGDESEATSSPQEGQESPLVTRVDFPASDADLTPGPEHLQGLSEVPLGTIQSLVPGRASGVGRGRGGGIGNRQGPGVSGRGNSAWVHLAHGTEEIHLSGNGLEYKNYIPPEYPEAARIDHISGDVVIQVTIDEAGFPTSWKVVDGHPALVKASLKVLPMWHFVPITHLGRKVRATIELTIRFSLI